jgi:hypothetical protein
MGRSGRTGTRYVTPIDSSGAPLVEQGKGRYVLTAGATYHYMLGGDDGPFQSVTLTGVTAAAVVTSATIMDTNHMPLEVSDSDATTGYWIPEAPSSGYVATTGTGWSAANSVVAALGTGVGGAMWHIAETGAARTRLTVVVGGTGGTFIVSAWGKM